MTKHVQIGAKSSAPGQFLGFTLQSVRLCFHLLTCKANSDVSVEFADDVAIHGADGTIVLEQTKSALTQNPVSDWAEDLWKTFANWTDQIEFGTIDPAKATFRLYVTPLKTGKWVVRLSNAHDDKSVEELVAEIAQKLKKKKPPPACAAHLDRFLSAPSSIQNQMVRNFTFESSHADPVDAIRQLIKVTVSDDMVEAVCEYAIGSAQKQVEELIRNHAIPKLGADQYRLVFKAFVKKHDLSNLLNSVAGEPSNEQVSALLARSPVFVQQLDLVHLAIDEKMRAVSALLQTSADKTYWAERGLVVPNSFDEFDLALVGRYSFVATEAKATLASLSAEDRGQTIYARCCMSPVKLENREVPSHFVPGCFNQLADELKVGWHPEYQAHFKVGKS